MRRRYKRELYQHKVELIRKTIPDCCIGVDVITGFPGETEEDFSETVKFLSGLEVSYLHVFTYSERENTLAYEMNEAVPAEIRQNRTKTLRTLSYRKMQAFTEKFIGTKRKVLFESRNKNGMMEGYTDNYIKVTVPFNKEWENEIVEWTI
jgi:threonylcarbamoyladenosine tRNA methylthiotransferase MtaB